MTVDELPKVGRLMGIDFGDRRIGIAVTDPMQITAQPHDTLVVKNQQEALRRIQQLVEKLEIAGIVVGLPVGLDGREGEMSRRVRQFAEEVQRQCECPVLLWDERLTSLQAERTLREFSMKPSRHKEKIDRLAATFLLRNFLDSQR